MVARYKRTKRRSGRKTQRRRRTTQRRRRNIRRGGMGDDRTEFYVRSQPTIYTEQVKMNFGQILQSAKRGQPGFSDPYFRWGPEVFDQRIALAQKLKNDLANQYKQRLNDRAAYISRLRTNAPKMSLNQMYNKTFGSQAGRDEHNNEKIAEVQRLAKIEDPDYGTANELLDSIINEMRSEKEMVLRNR